MSTSRRKILVTGASSGIGHATVRALAERGEHILATGRRTNPPPGWGSGTTIKYVAGDVLDADFIARLVEEAHDADILVNAAGFLRHAPFFDSEPSDWRTAFETNVLSVMTLTQGVARHMAQRGGGQIVMLTSTFAYEPPPLYAVAYAASKRALCAIADGLRLELSAHRIRVCEIAPGYTETGMRRHIDHPEVLDAHKFRNPPALSAGEVAEVIVFAVTNSVSGTIVVRPDMVR